MTQDFERAGGAGVGREVNGDAARERRGSTLIRGMMSFLAILTLGIPLTIIALYYAAGWQAAVLAFPLLFAGLGRLAPAGEPNTGSRRRRLLGRTELFVFLSAFPVAAVWWDKPEIMRFWAYAFAIALSLSVAFDGKARISRPATILASVTFVATSDLIWLFGSIAQWIWFHAFAVPISLFGFAFFQLAFTRRARARSPDITVEKVPPLRSEDDESSPALRCVINTGNGERWTFVNVSRSQVQAIYAAADWRGEHGRKLAAGAAWEGKTKPTFLVAFSGNDVLTFEADGPSTNTVQWIYMEARQKGRLFGSPGLIGERNVPDALGREIIADVWNEDFASVKSRLQPFASPLSMEA